MLKTPLVRKSAVKSDWMIEHTLTNDQLNALSLVRIQVSIADILLARDPASFDSYDLALIPSTLEKLALYSADLERVAASVVSDRVLALFSELIDTAIDRSHQLERLSAALRI